MKKTSKKPKSAKKTAKTETRGRPKLPDYERRTKKFQIPCNAEEESQLLAIGAKRAREILLG